MQELEVSLDWGWFQFVSLYITTRIILFTWKIENVFQKKTENSLCPEKKKQNMYREYSLLNKQIPVGSAYTQD